MTDRHVSRRLMTDRHVSRLMMTDRHVSRLMVGGVVGVGTDVYCVLSIPAQRTTATTASSMFGNVLWFNCLCRGVPEVTWRGTATPTRHKQLANKALWERMLMALMCADSTWTWSHLWFSDGLISSMIQWWIDLIYDQLLIDLIYDSVIDWSHPGFSYWLISSRIQLLIWVFQVVFIFFLWWIC